MKFADKLFHGPGQSSSPKFSREEAQESFGKTYKDEHRYYDYSPIRPDIPKIAFDTRPPTIKNIADSAKRKRNGATPGLDAITYVPFKKCLSLIAFLYRLGLKIWEEREIPADWARRYEHGDHGPGIQVLGLSFISPPQCSFPDGADTPFLSGSDHIG